MANLTLLYNFVNPEQLQQQLQDYYKQSITLKRAQYFFEKYAQQVSREIRIGLIQADLLQLRLNQIPMAWDRLRRGSGRIKTINGKDGYVADCFIANEVLVRRLTKGNQHEGKSMSAPTIPVEFLLNIATDQEIAQAIYQLPVDANQKNSETMADLLLDPTKIDPCLIDINSLEHYISKTEKSIVPGSTNKYQTTLNKNLVLAKTLKSINTVYGYIPQIINESEFGRRYYLGPNLQNAHKEVRHAALGDCYQYDIKTAVYAWKLDLAQEIIKETKQKQILSYTLEYIDQSRYHRQRLARLIQPVLTNTTQQDREKYIKSMFTAIGFGAKKNTNGWFVNGEYQRPALHTIIKNPEALEILLRDNFVYNFIEEQDWMNDTIFQWCKSIPTFHQQLRSKPRLLDKQNRLIKNRVLAFLYQTQERGWVDEVKAIIAKYQPDNTVLLTVHDGFYTRKRACLLEMREVLRQQNSYSDLEETKIAGYKDLSEEASFVQEHRDFIADEEQAAQEFFGTKSNIADLAQQFLAMQKQPFFQPNEKVYDGSGYTGYSDSYSPDDDPWFLEQSPEEQQEILDARNKILPGKSTVDPMLRDILSKRH